MADYIHKPQNVLQVDDRSGNAYTIFTVNHVASAAGNETAFEVEPSVISAKHLEESGQTVVTITLDSNPSEVPAGTGARRGYTKTLSFPSESATGTYVIVCRHAGTAAGIGGTHLDY